MGDISIIARRLSDKYVQYGWSGNGGVFSSRGTRLWEDYNSPDMVEYLFSLGQLRSLWSPGSENSSYLFRTEPTGRPHWVGTSELDIYSKIAFVDQAGLFSSALQMTDVRDGKVRQLRQFFLGKASFPAKFPYFFSQRYIIHICQPPIMRRILDMHGF